MAEPMEQSEQADQSPKMFLNEDTPPDLEVTANPKRVAMGHLGEGASMDDVAAQLVAAGIPEDRIHFVEGDDGLEFLDNLGTWFSRSTSEAWTKAHDHVESGLTIVSVFEVDEEDVGAVRDALEQAGVEHPSYYGTWTNLD
jgi:hypothetical protein